MDSATFERLRTIVYDSSGISLRETKEAMVSARIAKRMRALGIGTHAEYLHYLEHDANGDEITRFLDVISTNVTSFFRESQHFDFLRDILTARLRDSTSKIRLWSAAVSTGEEALSIAMVAHDVLGASPVDCRILATDISTRALINAQQGIYEAAQMENLPEQMRRRFFTPVRDSDAIRYRASDEIMRRIVYRRLNLSRPPFPMRGQLDVVFCRNVMIYFDTAVRERLVAEIYRLLQPGGYLFTGHAESLSSLKTDFACIRPTIYQKH
ncbi:MAG: protein-glutamate O-methyltransferase CheR [Deltaproteobacteria bacterium]|nr:protein-glutamate O-methyltransferase CheR [Deltaproteobacteria bacterium]